MEQLAVKIKTLRTFTLVYICVFLLALHFYFFYFINSSFLGKLFTSGQVGLLYALCGVLNVGIFLFISKTLKRVGNYRLMLGLILLELACLLGLAFIQHLWLIALLFIVSQAINPVLVFNLDVFLESVSRDEATGGIRGIFLTATNLPPIIAPLIVGIILTDSVYWKIYLIAAILLIPLLFILVSNFRHFSDPAYVEASVKDTWDEIWQNKDVRDILIDHFLLNFFYAWMVIYIPPYLNQVIGFSWPQIGIILSVMLLPFILFQLPLGRLADKKYGEKEILITGFVIMAVSTILIPYLKIASVILWAAILFATRVGASFVEVAAETYFFKKISAKDINLMSIIRMNRVLPYIFVPPIAYLSLTFLGMRESIVVLGLIMLIGLRYAFCITDTR